MKIRNATEKDIPVITVLGNRFVNEVPTWGQVARTQEQIQRLDKRLIWVAEENNEIIGYAIWLPRKNNDGCIFTENDKILVLDEIYLIPEARGKGIGSELLNVIDDYVKKEGYTKLLVYSSVKDLLPVISFYQDNGFKTWGIQLFKEVK